MPNGFLPRTRASTAHRKRCTSISMSCPGRQTATGAPVRLSSPRSMTPGANGALRMIRGAKRRKRVRVPAAQLAEAVALIRWNLPE